MSNYPCSFVIITISGGFQNFDLFKSSQVSDFVEKKMKLIGQKIYIAVAKVIPNCGISLLNY